MYRYINVQNKLFKIKTEILKLLKSLNSFNKIQGSIFPLQYFFFKKLISLHNAAVNLLKLPLVVTTFLIPFKFKSLKIKYLALIVFKKSTSVPEAQLLKT